MLIDNDLIFGVLVSHHDLQIVFEFVTLQWFLAKLPALDLVNFSDQKVFQIFFS